MIDKNYRKFWLDDGQVLNGFRMFLRTTNVNERRDLILRKIRVWFLKYLSIVFSYRYIWFSCYLVEQFSSFSKIFDSATGLLANLFMLLGLRPVFEEPVYRHFERTVFLVSEYVHWQHRSIITSIIILLLIITKCFTYQISTERKWICNFPIILDY